MLIRYNALEWDAADKFAYCWFMPFHKDDVRLERFRYYTIKVYDVTESASLVHRVEGKYVKHPVTSGSVITFNAKNRHALLPSELADVVVNEQSVKKATMWFNKHLSKCKNLLIEPKDHILKFRFIESC